MPTGVFESRVRRRITELLLSARQSGSIDDPEGPAAGQMLTFLQVGRMLDATPGLAEALVRPGTAVTIRLPSPTWADAIEDALDDVVRPLNARVRHRRIGFVREVPPSGRGRTRNRDPLEDADFRWMTIVGLWIDRRDHLPSRLLALSEIDATLCPATPQILRWLVRKITGDRSAAPPIAGDAAAILDPPMATIAILPGLTPAMCVERIRRLAGDRSIASGVPTLADMHGLDEARAWGERIARDMIDCQAGRLPWSALDRGAVLCGPPGTGKTLFAQALAATCVVPLIVTSVADWFATEHLGETLKRMRAIFAEARARRPCILLIDELQGIGGRDTLEDRHRIYWSQIINLLLESLDGSDRTTGIIFIGACNDVSRIDPALLRPGRLDRVFRVELPDAVALQGILRHYLGTDLPDADLEPLAAIALGASGAQVVQWVRDARRTARHAGRELQVSDLVAAIRGPSSSLPPVVMRRIAIHESGHAVVGLALGVAPSATISIGLRGQTGGYVNLERTPDYVDTRQSALRTISTLLGGRAAEEAVYGVVSGGAGGGSDSDLALATSLAASLEASYGLGGILVWRGEPGRLSVLMSNPDVACAVERTLAECYRCACRIVDANRGALIRVSDALLTEGHLSGKRLAAVVGELTGIPVPSDRHDEAADSSSG